MLERPNLPLSSRHTVGVFRNPPFQFWRVGQFSLYLCGVVLPCRIWYGACLPVRTFYSLTTQIDLTKFVVFLLG